MQRTSQQLISSHITLSFCFRCYISLEVCNSVPSVFALSSVIWSVWSFEVMRKHFLGNNFMLNLELRVLIISFCQYLLCFLPKNWIKKFLRLSDPNLGRRLIHYSFHFRLNGDESMNCTQFQYERFKRFAKIGYFYRKRTLGNPLRNYICRLYFENRAFFHFHI